MTRGITAAVGRRGAILATLGILAGCRGATSPAIVEEGYLHPMLAPDAATAAGAPVRAAPAEPRAARPPQGGPEKPGTAAAGAGKDGAVLAADASLPLADTDPARAEVVESARRLVGVVKSFDERSFLGHVLRVNALLPAGETASGYTGDACLRRARAGARVVEPAAARAGDVVLFECPSGCGATGQGGVGAAVVEHVEGGRLDLIAYTGDTVQRCWSGTGDPPARDRPRIDKVLAVVTLTR